MNNQNRLVQLENAISSLPELEERLKTMRQIREDYARVGDGSQLRQVLDKAKQKGIDLIDPQYKDLLVLFTLITELKRHFPDDESLEAFILKVQSVTSEASTLVQLGENLDEYDQKLTSIRENQSHVNQDLEELNTRYKSLFSYIDTANSNIEGYEHRVTTAQKNAEPIAANFLSSNLKFMLLQLEDMTASDYEAKTAIDGKTKSDQKIEEIDKGLKDLEKRPIFQESEKIRYSLDTELRRVGVWRHLKTQWDNTGGAQSWRKLNDVMAHIESLQQQEQIEVARWLQQTLTVLDYKQQDLPGFLRRFLQKSAPMAGSVGESRPQTKWWEEWHKIRSDADKNIRSDADKNQKLGTVNLGTESISAKKESLKQLDTKIKEYIQQQQKDLLPITEILEWGQRLDSAYKAEKRLKSAYLSFEQLTENLKKDESKAKTKVEAISGALTDLDNLMSPEVLWIFEKEIEDIHKKLDSLGISTRSRMFTVWVEHKENSKKAWESIQIRIERVTELIKAFGKSEQGQGDGHFQQKLRKF